MLLAALLFFLPGSGSLLAEKVATDYDHTAIFSTYRTYAWVEGTSAQDPVLDQTVRDAVDRQLTSHGYRRLQNSDRADVLVSYDAAIGQSSQLSPAGMGGWGWGWGNGGRLISAAVEAQSLPAGTLAIRIGDNCTHRIIWRGAAAGLLQSSEPVPSLPSSRDRLPINTLRDTGTSALQSAPQAERISPRIEPRIERSISRMFAHYPPRR
jgi:hypothetical protein